MFKVNLAILPIYAICIFCGATSMFALSSWVLAQEAEMEVEKLAGWGRFGTTSAIILKDEQSCVTHKSYAHVRCMLV